jgi:hypothetical protein
MRWAIAALLPALLLAAVACGGANAPSPTPTPRLSGPPYVPREVEADDDPNLPGEYIDLPAIYGGYYGNGEGINTAAHRRGPIDYGVQGLPPAGGPHWGSSVCPDLPTLAPPDCGPVPWGIYREPWPAESLVHNMEHAGVIIWYRTDDQDVIDDLERFAQEELRLGVLLVLTPYPDMEEDRIAITVWSRRDEFSAKKLDRKRLQHFIDVLYCRFDPEEFCQTRDGDLTVSAAGRYHLSAL